MNKKRAEHGKVVMRRYQAKAVDQLKKEEHYTPEELVASVELMADWYTELGKYLRHQLTHRYCTYEEYKKQHGN